jgi:hypothetical protein
MIVLNFVIGILAGLAVPSLERAFRDFAESVWLGDLPLSDDEFDLAAMLVVLMLAAILIAAIGGDSSAFMLAFGALVGLFGKRIWVRISRGEP